MDGQKRENTCSDLSAAYRKDTKGEERMGERRNIHAITQFNILVKFAAVTGLDNIV